MGLTDPNWKEVVEQQRLAKLEEDQRKKAEQERMDKVGEEILQAAMKINSLADPPEKEPAKPVRRILKIPDTKGALRGLSSRPVLQTRFRGTKTWENIKQWCIDRTADLIEFDGLERNDAKRQAWIEVSFIYPPSPEVLSKHAPDHIKQAIKKETQKEEQMARTRLKKRVKKIADVKEVDLGKFKKDFTVPTATEANFGGSFEGLKYEEHDAEQLCRDVMWVYQKMNVEVKKSRSPSAGAYNLLMWARENQDSFFKGILPSALKTKETLEKIRQDAETKREEMRLKAKEQEKKENQMSPEEVKELAKTLDLCREFGVEFSQVSQGIQAPSKEVPDELKEMVGVS